VLPFIREDKEMPNNQGLTLVELMTVIAIIAILISVSTFDFFKSLSTRRLSSAVNEIESMMQFARIKAVRENADVVVTFNPDWNQRAPCVYQTFIDNGRGGHFSNGFRDSDEPIIKTGAIPKGISLIETAFGKKQYTRFNGLGLGLAGHVYLKNNRDEYMGIIASITGSVRIVKSMDGGMTWK